MEVTMNYANGAGTEVFESQNINTTSVSIEFVDSKFAEDFYGLRNNPTFDFWKSDEEDLY